MRYLLEIFIFLTILLSQSVFCYQGPFEAYPLKIKFNCMSGSAYDAIKIAGISAPEWNQGNSNNFGYIKNQTNRIVHVKFYCNLDSSKVLQVDVSVNSGDDFGSLTDRQIAFSGNESDYCTFVTDGAVPASVGIRQFTWKWEIEFVRFTEPGTPVESTTGDVNYTSHEYYTIINAPVAPESEPSTTILEYACTWANGTTSSGSACNAILDNGFDAHYTWNWDCHRLSSDFVRLVASLGISASQHRWSSIDWDVGNMVYQETRAINPVGPAHGHGSINWAWHQWAEANGSQRDPSAAYSRSGSWGGYEDYLFTYYLEAINSSTAIWVENQSGQSQGCEAPGHRYYSSSPTVYNWRGPDH
jgi:hypothetical protein